MTGHRDADASSLPEVSPAQPPNPSLVRRQRLGDAPGPIAAGDSFAAAGRKAMWLHVERLLSRESALRDPEATDSLKRYRVATRRLRAAMRVFRDAWPKRAIRPLRAGLADLADAVGAVRDLDVRLEHLAAWAAGHGDEAVAGVAPLQEAWARQRAAAADRLERRIDARRHARLLDALVAFVTHPDDGPPPRRPAGPPERRIGDRAPSAAWTAYEQVRAYAPVVAQADDATLHQLRIEAKRLRYTLEFLADLLGPERTWLVERLVELQDHLGALNDAVLGAAATRQLLAEQHAALGPAARAAIGRYLADREREAAGLRRGVPRHWRPIEATSFERRLASAVAPRRGLGPQRQPRTRAEAAGNGDGAG